MKRTISIALAAALLCVTPVRPVKAGGLAVLVIVCAAGAGGLVIWMYVRTGEVKKRAVVLESSHYDGNWIPVATQIMVVPPNLVTAFPAFWVYMKDDTASYRLKEIPMPPTNPLWSQPYRLVVVQ